ncbi:uncharacterized protein G2W53_032873 [Senna tora]|uniref:Uncharacterized protein n=1 Tax=Senna tora TaxID=362788 RepID=A0A834W7B5_9FABA|nr:uncharacterized protein G2W53_032873 [Senna tora]
MLVMARGVLVGSSSEVHWRFIGSPSLSSSSSLLYLHLLAFIIVHCASFSLPISLSIAHSLSFKIWFAHSFFIIHYDSRRRWLQ